MGTSIRRTAIWLVLAALSIAGAAWMATGVSADAGAQPTTAQIKIIKQPTPGNAQGPWLFTWACDDLATTSGTALYPDDFAPGKEYDVPGDIAIGTDCTITETFPNNDGDAWDTSYQIEQGPFESGTVALVEIRNGGTQTVKFKNAAVDPEPYQFQIKKTQVGGPDTNFEFTIQCTIGTPGEADVAGVAGATVFSNVIETESEECTVTETGATPGGLDDWITDPATRAITLDLNPDGVTVFEFTNTWTPPKFKKITIAKIQVGYPPPTEFSFSVQCDGTSVTGVGSFIGTMEKTIDVPADTKECTVTEVSADSPGGLAAWTTTPGLSITKPLVDDEIALFEFTNTWVEEPEGYQIQIVKDQEGGPLDTSFEFTIVCATGTSGPIGTEDPVSVLGNDTSGIINIPADYNQCTVTEVFHSASGDQWITFAGKNEIPSRELTLLLDPENVTSFIFENRYVEPEPEIATVIVEKKFEGPDDWNFGFAFLCQAFGNADTFVLGGGESSPLFTIPFHTGNGTLTNGEENGNGGPYTVCAAVEQALVGPWTVNVSVSGAPQLEAPPPPPDSDIGAVAFFEVHPGDEIVVTFENIPGYGAQPPSGIPPDLQVEPR
jgi:hypothetical protein